MRYRVVFPTAKTPFLIALVLRWCSTTCEGTGRTELSSVIAGVFEDVSRPSGCVSGREGTTGDVFGYAVPLGVLVLVLLLLLLLLLFRRGRRGVRRVASIARRT